MKQYCRYCSNLVYGDWPYCEKKEKTMSESAAKRANTCKDFDLNPIDAFGENEKGYQPRREKTPEEIALKERQVSFL